MKKEAIQKGDRLSGFIVDRIVELTDLSMTLFMLSHEKTGAQYIHIKNDDENNLFSIAFRTTPMDSTGVAHILEHTVLCGSKKFPVRDPFFSMLKRSLNTFMNALTANDWTMYPFSTQNEKDFYNLMDVYLDATFFPNIRELSFKQEGWRVEFEETENRESKLTYKGVVYNEMKGAMSDPASLMHRRLQRALYPSSTYHHNSGGEPANIPDLSWEQLKEFHGTYYHPSNAKFFTYGNLPLEKHLKVIEERVLSGFEKLHVDSEVKRERRYESPQREEFTYPIEAATPAEEQAKKSFVSVAWLTCDARDAFEVFTLKILSSLLLGSPAAPLYKALMDSKLGTQLAPGTGYDDENRDTCFAAGLQGANCDDAGAIEKVLIDTLEKLAGEGFPEERVEAVIHQLEFSNKEVVGNYYPYALNILFRLFGPWLHDGDPVSPLLIDEHIERLRKEMKAGPFFQEKIKEYLLNNSHKVQVILKPDTGLAAKEANAETKRLEETRKGLTEAQIDKVISDSLLLKKEQESEEDINCLPTLQIDDIPDESYIAPHEYKQVSGFDSYWFDQPTNGISYFTALAKTESVPEELKPYVPLFCSIVTKIGAAGHDYTEMAERIEAHTGGVSTGANLWEDLNDLSNFDEVVEFNGKALVSKQEELFAILRDIVSAPDFRDYKRLHTLIGQIKTSMENSIPGSGHSYARGLASRHLTKGGKQREQWFGISYLHLIKELAKLKEDELAPLAHKMEAIAASLVNKKSLKISVVTEKRFFSGMEKAMLPFISAIKEGSDISCEDVDFTASPCVEGWGTNVPVSYVAQVFKTVPYSHSDSPALLVLSKLLRACYLHREIREKGGAYGGFASYSASEGLFSFLSYRDPHLERTLKVYKDAINWVIKGEFSDEDLKEAMLSTFSDIDKPLSPAGKGDREFVALLRGLTSEMRQLRRKALLSLTRQDMVNAARVHLRDGLEKSAIAIISGTERLEETKDSKDGLDLTINHI
ncbi:MAG: insulinase family protein [Deltaproteobacteria bacterium]|nr:insulinase family protein [Deltaproteobacteria bacterium]